MHSKQINIFTSVLFLAFITLKSVPCPIIPTLNSHANTVLHGKHVTSGERNDLVAF